MWDRTTATIRVLSDEEACLAESSLHTLSLQILISSPGLRELGVVPTAIVLLGSLVSAP